jgi:ABC-type glycerol-3-phosphate transport system substrate-binding protein
MVTDLKAKYDLGYYKSQATLGNGTYTSTKFTAKEIMMSVGSTGGTTYNYTENFTTGVAALPQADLDAGKVIMQGPSVCFFSKATADQKLAAWLFYKFITNTKNSAIWSVSTGYNPVRTSSFTDPVYTTRSDTTGAKGLVKTVADFLADSANHYSDWYYTSPAFKGSSTARVQMGALMGSVMLGTKTVEKAFTDAMSNCLFAS